MVQVAPLSRPMQYQTVRVVGQILHKSHCIHLLSEIWYHSSGCRLYSEPPSQWSVNSPNTQCARSKWTQIKFHFWLLLVPERNDCSLRMNASNTRSGTNLVCRQMGSRDVLHFNSFLACRRTFAPVLCPCGRPIKRFKWIICLRADFISIITVG